MGNKAPILPIIYSLFPLEYGRFVEVFGGSGSVLLGKPPDPFEVYVYKDYALEVEFNVAFEDFQNLVAECQGLRQTEPDIYVTPITKENRPA